MFFISVCQSFCSGGMHGGGHVSRGACVAGGLGMCGGRGACVAGETATAADGTHPTGMLSCSHWRIQWARPPNVEALVYSSGAEP